MSDDETRVIVERLSALPEPYVLRWFWLMINQGADRLSLLHQLSQVTVVRPRSWDVQAIRREHENTPVHPIMRMACFVCADAGMLYRHHIVEVHHGGSNAPRNQVALCFPCHKALHPWLEQPRRGEPSLAEQLRQRKASA